MSTSAMVGLFALAFTAWLGLSAYVIVDRLRHERRKDSLGKVMERLGHAQPLLLTSASRPQPGDPLITQLPAPVVYRAAADVTDPTPAARRFAEHALVRWGPANVFAVAAKARPGTDRWQRVSALSILARAGTDGVHELLFDALQDRDADVASSAAVLLGRLNDLRAAEILVTALRLHLYLPSFIARQLDGFTIPLDHLLQPLLDAGATHARYWAVVLLTRQDGRPHPHAERIAALADDPDPAVRKAVAQALGMLGTADEALVVLKLLYDDIGFVRAHAATALARFRWPEFAGSLAGMLDDPDWRVRLAAREALAAMEQGTAPDASAPATADEAAENGAEHIDGLYLHPFHRQGRTTAVHARVEGRRT